MRYTVFMITSLSDELQWRGLIKDKTFSDRRWLDQPRTFYLGTDCSSDSLTIGNLAVYMLARRMVKFGWKPVLLVGGATSLIGDPGGKTEERELKSLEEIEHNVQGIRWQVEKLFAGSEVTIVNNYDWFREVGFLQFLRDIGKHYSMTELLQRDFVTERIGAGGSGISYAEFSYSLIQGYDYWYLFKRYGVELQIGGSDQWGNMLSGVPLVRKKEGKEVHAMSAPLVVNKTTGRKFGKSEEGAVWLDPAKTSPTQFYQFWINVDDAGVGDYLKIYTELNETDILIAMTEHNKDPKKRHAQKLLAQEVTKTVHGEDQAALASAVTAYLTSEVSIVEADDNALAVIRQEIKSTQLTAGTNVTAALVHSGLASSNSDARRLIESGAVYVNGQSINREQFEEGDFINGRLLLRRGKALKDTALIELS